MNSCACKNPSLVQREGDWVCAACLRAVNHGVANSSRADPKRAKLPPEKAEALRAINNLRREVNEKLDRLKAEVLKQ